MISCLALKGDTKQRQALLIWSEWCVAGLPGANATGMARFLIFGAGEAVFVKVLVVTLKSFSTCVDCAPSHSGYSHNSYYSRSGIDNAGIYRNSRLYHSS